MKKYIMVFLVLYFMIFFLPAMFAKKYNLAGNNVQVNKTIEEAKEKEKENEKKQEAQYDYKEYSTIKLLHSKTGEIEELSLDTYLLGVVSAEMPASFEQEALNAQALVARTYTIYSIAHSNGKHDGADICDSPNCCQAWISQNDRMEKWDESVKNEYWEKIHKAVDNTKGKIITYEGEPIDAFFHSNSGGITEIPANVWGGRSFPYLQAVQTSGEDAYSQYNSEVTINKEDLINKVKEKHANFEINFEQTDCIKVLDYTDSGRVKTIKMGNLELSGVEIRSIIGLKSANFKVEILDNKVKFEVVGYGHGVGMSQTGADSMAKKGCNYEEIIKHFYTGVEISNF